MNYSSYRLAEALPKITELGKVLGDKFGIKDAKIEAARIKKELGSNWRKAAGIEIEKKPKNIEVVVWKHLTGNYSSGIDPVRMKPSAIERSTVRIRGNMKTWIDLLKKYSVRDYGVTKEIKGLKRGMSEEEFRDQLSKKSVTTRDGMKSLGEVADPITVFQFCDPEILKFYKPSGSEIICTTTDEETFEAVAYLKLANKEFKTTDVVSRKALKQELLKCCGNSNKDDSVKSVFALVGKDAGDKEAPESWTVNQQDAANYLYIAVSMMNSKKAEDAESRTKRRKLVSLLWDSLSSISSTEKMKSSCRLQ